MAFTEGNTNRECCYFWDGGVVGKRQSILQKRWLGYLLYCKLLLYLQRGLATFRTDTALSGQYPIRPWTIANIGRLNNGSNVTPVFNYTYTIV